MKSFTKFFLAIFSMFLIKMNVHATIHTVNNGALSAGSFTNLQSAINAASNGDTLYIHGSTNNYGDITLKKKLTLIGAGYFVTGTETNNLSTSIGDITMDTIFNVSGASGCKLISLEFGQMMLVNSNYFPVNTFISRCKITTAQSFPNSIIENSILSNLYVRASSAVIRNNIIRNFAGYSVVAVNVIIDHNIFSGGYPSYISYALFTNNIFFDVNPVTQWYGVENCIFNNNLISDNTSIVLPFGNNTGTGNITTVLPSYQFNNTLISNSPTPWIFNWTLNTSSPGNNAATDGTDIGIYGGNFPMKNLTGASNLIPQMNMMNISNSSIPLNGILNVSFKSRKQN
jgi:hypothetical protein